MHDLRTKLVGMLNNWPAAFGLLTDATGTPFGGEKRTSPGFSIRGPYVAHKYRPRDLQKFDRSYITKAVNARSQIHCFSEVLEFARLIQRLVPPFQTPPSHDPSPPFTSVCTECLVILDAFEINTSAAAPPTYLDGGDRVEGSKEMGHHSIYLPASREC